MHLIKEFMKSLVLFLFVIVALILVVLFPRELIAIPAEQRYVIEFEYQLDWTEYRDNVTQFLIEAWENKSLGTTLRNDITVETEISRYLPRSLAVIMTSFLISIALGVLKGLFDYRNRQNRKIMLGYGSTSFFLAVPDFFLILCLQWLIPPLVVKKASHIFRSRIPKVWPKISFSINTS